jgi:preprotein translocase subunit SecE
VAKTRTKKTNGTSEETKVADAKTPVAEAESTAPARPRVSPFKFLQQVRQEVSKVTWPTRKETTVTTAMVFVMVVLSAFFFLAIDAILGTAVRLALQALS